MDLQSGYPFSLIRYGIPFEYPRLGHSVKTDVLIVGGGISGALMAYHLCRAGIDCVVVDRRSIGLGSTCASTSLLQYEIDVPLVRMALQRGETVAARAYTLCREAIYQLADIAHRVRLKQFAYNKSLYFAAFGKHVPLLAAEYQARKKHGFKVDFLNQRDVRKAFGFTAPAAILSHDGAYTDAYMFTHHLLQYCISEGVRVYDRTTLAAPVYHSSGVTVNTGTRQRISARYLVYATGYEVTELFGKRQKIVDLQSTYAIAGEQLPEGKNQWSNVMLWNTADPYLYVRGTTDHRIVVGGRDENFFSAPKRDALIKRKAAALERDFKKLFPKVPFSTEFRWTGTFGITKDGLPYIGTHKKYPRTFFSLGFGGNGIVFSLMAARMAVDFFRGRKNADAGIFAFDR